MFIITTPDLVKIFTLSEQVSWSKMHQI